MRKKKEIKQNRKSIPLRNVKTKIKTTATQKGEKEKVKKAKKFKTTTAQKCEKKRQKINENQKQRLLRHVKKWRQKEKKK